MSNKGSAIQRILMAHGRVRGWGWLYLKENGQGKYPQGQNLRARQENEQVAHQDRHRCNILQENKSQCV